MLRETISHYRILEKLGQGGMGEVYLAEDQRLGRKVALKFLAPGRVATGGDHARFLREAHAASALDHPNIGTLFDIQETKDGQTYLVMAHYPGDTLEQRLSRKRLTVEQVLDFATQIADGLAAAHAKNIIHRDVKPANLLLTDGDRVKIIDFGLARDLGATALTVGEHALGTAAYMSPEQATGKSVDARSDVWALGVLLYEMLGGRKPFEAESPQALLYQVVHENAPSLAELAPELPEGLVAIIERAMAKDPQQRFAKMEEMGKALRAQMGNIESPPARGSRLVRWGAVAVPALLAAWVVMLVFKGNDTGAEKRSELLVDVRDLIGESRDVEAFLLLRDSGIDIASDPALLALYNECSVLGSVESDPPGARVSFKDYLDVDGDWIDLGSTPMAQARLPLAFLRIRFEKEGYRTLEIATTIYSSRVRTVLTREDDTAEGMELIPEGAVQLGSAGLVSIASFWMDTYEVSNAQFQEFVDAGGYRSPEYWQHPFFDGNRILQWEEAMQRFLDATGRNGPSTWELGRYPRGQGNHPVGGISWYEAAAYLEFAGKQMPTVYHWRHAAGLGTEGEILLLSNFESDGTAPVGTFEGIGPYGNHDMAGNIQEWAWNESNGRRYSLGGSWSSAPYEFSETDTKTLPPMSRDAVLGVRGMKTPEAVPDRLLDSIDEPVIDFAKEKPVSDEVFAAILESYAYDRVDLDTRVEGREEHEHWFREKVSFRAPYGQERVPAYLFLPKNVDPPYQTVLWFPGGSAETVSSSSRLTNLRYWDFVIKSGRALMYPIYENMYERQQDLPERGPNTRANNIRHWSQDVRRSVDYLQTRPDIASDRIAYYSLSLGSTYGPIFLAVEPRFRCAVLLAAGLFSYPWTPEVKPLNFVPRVHVPTLVVTGMHDFGLPVETSVKPFVDLLGVPPEHKQLYLFDGDHVPRANEVVKVTLDWLDRYLGQPGSGR